MLYCKLNGVVRVLSVTVFIFLLYFSLYVGNNINPKLPLEYHHNMSTTSSSSSSSSSIIIINQRVDTSQTNGIHSSIPVATSSSSSLIMKEKPKIKIENEKSSSSNSSSNNNNSSNNNGNIYYRSAVDIDYNPHLNSVFGLNLMEGGNMNIKEEEYMSSR
jgi:hypothetical protein